MHQALYRKYRPTTFDDVCGQEHITSVLKYETEHSKTSHAYLFCGSRGTGKTTCAKILAKAINCLNPVNGNPCGCCDSCRDIDAGSATDVLEMDAASNNGVDYIREIRDEVTFTPAMLKKRVYIIDEVHMLTPSAFNALLKTLEEPPEHVVFILATTELHKLPATIISRCQRFDFRRIIVSVIADRLKYIASVEGIILEDEAASLIAKQAQGGLRDAISILELCSGGGSDVTAKRVSDILGLTGYDLVYKTVMSIAKGDIASLFRTVADVVSSSKDLTVFLQELMSFYRDMLVAKYADDVSSYLDLTQPEKEMLLDATSKFGLQTIIYHCNVLDEAMISAVRSPQIKRTTVEFALVRMCEPRLDQSAEALTARVEAIEDKLAKMSVSPVMIQQCADEDAPIELPAEPSAKTEASPIETANADEAVDDGFTQIVDISEATERLRRTNIRICSYVNDAEILVSHDRRKLVIKSNGEFAATMLSSPDSKQSIADAFAIAGITEGIADITVQKYAKKDSGSSPIDDLFR